MQQIGEGGMLVFCTVFLLFPSSSFFLSSTQLANLFFFSNSLRDNIEWPTRLDMSFDKASVSQLDAPSDWRPGGRGFNPHRGRQHSFVEIDHEIFSTVILSLPLIQEGQLSVSGERMCTILVNRLED